MSKAGTSISFRFLLHSTSKISALSESGSSRIHLMARLVSTTTAFLMIVPVSVQGIVSVLHASVESSQRNLQRAFPDDLAKLVYVIGVIFLFLRVLWAVPLPLLCLLHREQLVLGFPPNIHYLPNRFEMHPP